MTDLREVERRLRENKRTIARLRRQSRETYGRDKANWPEFRLQHIHRLIVQCRADESTLKQAFGFGSSPAVSHKPFLSLVVDNEKAAHR